LRSWVFRWSHAVRRSSDGRSRSASLSTVGMAVLLVGCNDLTGTPDLPAGTSSVDDFNTPAGALGFYRDITTEFGFRLADLAVTVGLATDELQAAAMLGNTNPVVSGTTGFPEIDSRADLSN